MMKAADQFVNKIDGCVIGKETVLSLLMNLSKKKKVQNYVGTKSQYNRIEDSCMWVSGNVHIWYSYR